MATDFIADLRYAWRALRRSPGFTLTAVLSLALGVGANTAIFSLIDAVMLKMLPIAHPEQLVYVNTRAVQVGNFRVSLSISNAALKQLQLRATRVASLAAYQTDAALNVAVNGQAELASGHFVSETYFSVLGVQPILGRAITASDHRVALIGYGYWQRRFGRDPGVLGKEVTINNVPFTIVGVTPREFYGLSTDTPAEVMVPAATMPQINACRITSDLPKPDANAGSVFARLKSGVDVREAAAELSAILRQEAIAAAGSEPNPQQRGLTQKLSVELTPAGQGISRVRNRFSKPLEALMVVTGLVMLIACANIANLLLARSSVRRREIAIRLSLGSTRWRLMRQLLTESLLLSGLGTVLGIPIAIWAREGIIHLAITQRTAPAIPLQWDFRVLAFTAAVCIVNAFLFGIAPALRATAVDLAAALKSGGRAGRAGRIPLGRVLIAGQVAISLALLVGAGLFLGTFRNLDRIDLGYARDHALLVTFDPHLAGYQGARAAQVYRQVLERAARIPGVRSVSLMRDKLLTGQVSMSSIWVPGYTLQRGEDPANLWVISNGVGPRFFAALGMPLITGRDFSVQDNEHAPKVAVINQTMARHFFGNRDPLGRHVGWGRSEGASIEIVGMVRDIKYIGVREEKQDVIFTPFLQNPESWKQATLLVRTTGNPAGMASSVRDVIRAIDRNLPVYDVTTIDRQVESSLVQQRLMAILSGFFGLLALGLSAIGLYGVLSYAVAQRTGEIGVRLALGAQRGSILRLMLAETAQLVCIGIVIGIAIAAPAARLITSMLFGVTPTDAASLAAAIAMLTVAALLAGFVPARRASQVDPMVALRHE